MQVQTLGGNQLRIVELNLTPAIDIIEFSNCSYQYFSVLIPEGMSYTINNFPSYSIFFLKVAKEAQLKTSEGIQSYLKNGDSVKVENTTTEIKAIEGPARLLVAATKTKHFTQASVIITKEGNHYRVVKPWGHELWINGEHPGYVLKEVMIKQGHRTSMQYHNFKEETNVLMDGKARFIYKKNPAVENAHINLAEDLGEINLKATAIVHVPPKTLHRFTALTDILLYEVSTPYLDDVIRVSDDHHRQNGRVVSEHSA